MCLDEREAPQVSCPVPEFVPMDDQDPEMPLTVRATVVEWIVPKGQMSWVRLVKPRKTKPPLVDATMLTPETVVSVQSGAEYFQLVVAALAGNATESVSALAARAAMTTPPVFVVFDIR